MKTGSRFWYLLGIASLILGGYGLAELSDAVHAKRVELNSQRLLLAREEELLRDNRWPERARAIQKIRRDWQAYLPVEDSPALAKAHLLSTWRKVAGDAGLMGLSVGAADSESADQDGSAKPGSNGASQSSKGKNPGKANTLPPGVQMTKLTISGRFEPAAFVKFLRALEQDGQFVRIERATVRATQLELGLRAYWRLKAASPVSAKSDAPAVMPPTKS